MLENKDKPGKLASPHLSGSVTSSLVMIFLLLNLARADMIRMITQVIHYMLESHQFATRLAQPFEQSVLPTAMRI